MDAISFGLGVKASNLRGTNLKDLIFSATNPQTRRKAYVTVVIEAENGEEIHFTRSISPSGVGECKINGRGVSAAEYEEELKQMNILVKARNFLVFQGDVESIAAKSPIELTKMVELISGSIELKEEYDRLLLEKDKAEQETIFHYQKRKGLAAEKKQYKEQTEEAKKYQLLCDQRDLVRLEQILWQFYIIDHSFRKSLSDIDKWNRDLSDKKRSRDIAEQEWRTNKQKLATLSKGLIVKDKEIGDVSKEITKENPKRVKVKEEISRLSQHIKDLRAQEKQQQVFAKRQREDMDNLQKQMDLISQQLQDLDESSGSQMDLEFSQGQLREYAAKKEELARETAKQNGELDEILRIQKGDQDELAALESQQKNLNERRAQLEQQEIDLKERIQIIANSIQEQERKKKDLQVQMTTLKRENRQLESREIELTNLLQTAEDQVREAKANRHESEREQQALQLLEDLKRHHQGVHGRLFDLCKPISRKYNVAVTVALGRNMDAIVVDTQAVAIDCIKYMKDQRRSGMFTFIPLDTVRTKPLNESLRNLGGTTKLVMDVIQADPYLHKALLYACGNMLCCESLAEARSVAFGTERQKVVTLDGSLIRKSGVMTGGLSGVEGRANRWDEKKLEEIKRQQRKYREELNEIAGKKNIDGEKTIDSKIRLAEETITRLQDDQLITNKKLEGTHAQLKVVDENLNSLLPKVAKLQKSVQGREDKVSELQRAINRIADRIFADFSKQIGIKNWREYEEQQNRMNSETTDRKVQLNAQLTRLRIQMDVERKKDASTKLAEVQKKIASAEDRLKTISADDEKMEESKQALEARKQNLETEKAEIKNDINSAEVAVKTLKKRTSDLSEELSTIQKSIASSEAKVEQLRNDRHSLYQKCRVEEIEVPFKRGSLEDAVQLPDTQMDTDAGTQQSQFIAEDNLEVDFSSLPANIRKEVATDRHEEVNSQFMEKLQRIQIDMDRISPNLHAVDHLDDARSRLQNMNKEFDDSKRRAKEASEKFNKCKQDRYELFMKAFNSISESIDHIYKELTRSNTQMIGGTAYLDLENPEEPYLAGIKFTAQPPLKRYREMDQLSGGEKTIAALGLLFAIHRFHPSPFFILDEIDAALDRDNVSAIVRYIQAHRDEFQCLVISLKDSMYDKADSLVGVYRDRATSASSTLTLDLAAYGEASA
eukprot:TRINITY_DN4533_c0_g1_i4.p1 TRINITY_DN4533_c0_g1~~TRINITY_DN4533_c0_g1_i4.p1  ORF type:complete len:1175 (+),score=260.58 TRINITY_DN4533_c0_g1_i4:389-3913(+)